MSRSGRSKEYEALSKAMTERIFVGSDPWETAREKLEGVHGSTLR